MAFRFLIIKVSYAHFNLLFFQYLIEMIVRLTWVLLFIHSFKESFILNTLSLITVWIVVPSLYVGDSYNDENINTIAYSFVIFGVIVFAYVLEKQQKEAFYYQWLANSKAKWLTNVFENLNSGFVSIKNSKISYINQNFRKFLLNLESIDKLITKEILHEYKSSTFSNGKKYIEKLSINF